VSLSKEPGTTLKATRRRAQRDQGQTTKPAQERNEINKGEVHKVLPVANDLPNVTGHRNNAENGYPPSNPYGKITNDNEEQQISEDLFRKVLKQLPPPPASLPPGKCLKEFKVDTYSIGRRSMELQTVGIILFTASQNPSRDFIEEWAYEEWACNLGVQIIQVRVLAASVFLIIVESAESRSLVLSATPVMVAGRLALVLPYDAAMNIQNLQYKANAVWIELVSRYLRQRQIKCWLL
jgi:hypothetical protein